MLLNENQKLEIRANKYYELLMETEKANDYVYKDNKIDLKRYSDKRESKKHMIKMANLDLMRIQTDTIQ